MTFADIPGDRNVNVSGRNPARRSPARYSIAGSERSIWRLFQVWNGGSKYHLKWRPASHQGRFVRPSSDEFASKQESLAWSLDLTFAAR
jgi:hypothetical protein